ncbi:hypothetical protein [Streptococcus sciuri]|uniref:Uncharacterized protein n=1 Tax=Streptococcus sciuri TaxID=2973939 RepID=A0ABT2F6J7_9STRE|nr:hypothetical protein [Streptococcus sciuri]MCS4487813.1 hypothetical protein [Streptococcus sciuri]
MNGVENAKWTERRLLMDVTFRKKGNQKSFWKKLTPTCLGLK